MINCLSINQDNVIELTLEGDVCYEGEYRFVLTQDNRLISIMGVISKNTVIFTLPPLYVIFKCSALKWVSVFVELILDDIYTVVWEGDMDVVQNTNPSRTNNIRKKDNPIPTWLGK